MIIGSIIVIYGICIFIIFIINISNERRYDNYDVTDSHIPFLTNNIGHIAIIFTFINFSILFYTTIYFYTSEVIHKNFALLLNIIAYFFSIIFIILNKCINNYRPCFDTETPIYMMIFIHDILLTFVAIIYIIYKKCKRNNNQELRNIIIHRNDENNNEERSMRFFLLDNITISTENIVTEEKIKYGFIIDSVKFNHMNTCIICLIEFIENESIIMLSCKHYYHEICLNRWKKNRSICPLCKKYII